MRGSRSVFTLALVPLLSCGPGDSVSPEPAVIEPTSLAFGAVEVGRTREAGFLIANPDTTPLTGEVAPLGADVELVGEGTAPDGHASCRVAPRELHYFDVPPGESRDESFLITNVGEEPMTGAVEDACAEFAVIGGAGPYTLAPGESREVTVRFTAPDGAVSAACELPLGVSCGVVSCSAQSSVPSCFVEPPALSFGNVLVGSSATAYFTVTNRGGGLLAGTVTEACAEVSIIGVPSYALGSGQSRSFTVRFSPLSAGAVECALVVGGDCADIPCSGTGVLPNQCTVDPQTLAFGNVPLGVGVDRTYTITNSGGGGFSGVPGELCAMFSYVSGGEPYTLAPGESHDVTIRFLPTRTGERSCTADTGYHRCADVGLVATGILNDECEVWPGSLPFGDVDVGTFAERSFTITNWSQATLHGAAALDTCTAFQLFSGGGSYSLEPGQTHTVLVRFLPTTTGHRVCRVKVGTAICSDVIAYGTGVPPGPRASSSR